MIRRIELLRVAIESLLRNKMRSLLTMLGVIIGVGAVIIMVSISAGTEAQIEDQITRSAPSTTCPCFGEPVVTVQGDDTRSPCLDPELE